MTSTQHSLQVVILAGGLGTNLRPLTAQTPKPMVLVSGKPFLHYQLEYLREQGLKDILILTGYLADHIKEFFKDGSSLGLNITYSQEDQPLGTGGALLYAQSFLENQFLLINGDSFLPFDYQDFIRCFLDSDKLAQMSILSEKDNSTGVRNNIEFDEDSGLIKTYQKTGQSTHLQYVDAGVLALRKGLFSAFPKKEGLLSLEKEVYPILIERKEFLGYPASQRFYDIGTPERLKEFERYIEHDYLKNAL